MSIEVFHIIIGAIAAIGTAIYRRRNGGGGTPIPGPLPPEVRPPSPGPFPEPDPVPKPPTPGSSPILESILEIIRRLRAGRPMGSMSTTIQGSDGEELELTVKRKPPPPPEA